VARTPDDEFIVLATDGLWGVLTSAKVVRLARLCIERAVVRGASRPSALRVAANVLVKAALKQGSSDNITVIIMDLESCAHDA
jgi:protein phosphatase 2C